LDVLWSTLPKRAGSAKEEKSEIFPPEPEENILYIIEKNAPELPAWKREIIRIVRKIAQYFYPQRLTKVLNEGFATFTHYYIMNRLSEKGLITSGAMQEFIHAHTGVVAQPDFAPMNPYALGFNMFMDIKRICETPDEEDRKWFPDIAGSPWLPTIKFVAEAFKDESAILQFLSPLLIRKMRLFTVLDDNRKDHYLVAGIHNEDGYRHVRKQLSRHYDEAFRIPIVEVARVDRRGDRTLTLHDRQINRRPLHADDAKKVLKFLEKLWEFPVEMEVYPESGETDKKPVWRIERGEWAGG
ncbi:MAG: SpoVR family protein, partial [candidate division Zixibacteria bacterium]|nr:SpoVR family protein [candidate division Zixibacteria bacterium]